ncbi:MAG: hypothetical protein HKM07_07965 [Chlamydiae bacterium]|nr:hypothetical protein [Chlamydiota bacterium]
MNILKIEAKGSILEGEFKNWNIFVKDINNGKGAYLILLTSPDNSKGYDDWVKNFHDLEGYFKEANWKILWLDEKMLPS